MQQEQIKSIVIGVLSLVVLGLLYINYGASPGTITSQQAAESALAYINGNLLGGAATAEIVGDIVDEGGVYKMELKVQDQQFPTYMTKDGKILFPQGIDMEEVEEVPEVLTCNDIGKAEMPEMEAFVVSYCPYGLQMQRILVEVITQMSELADNINIRYMGDIVEGEVTSMHGEEEAEENLRQICLREEQSDEFIPYLSCFIKAGDTETCLEGIDVDKLNTCMTSTGLDYAQEDFDKQKEYQVTGSPALFLNQVKVSEFDFGGRTAEAVKTLLCCGFNQALEVCQTELTKEDAAASFSETYSSGGAESGSCE